MATCFRAGDRRLGVDAPAQKIAIAAFVGAADVTIKRVTPARLAAPLRRALAAS